MNKLPDAVWIVDTVKEHIAVQEANRLGIPVVAVVDTNCDPDVIDFVIPGNDDAIRSGALLTQIIADACAEGYIARACRTSDDVVAEQAAAITAAAAAGAAAVQTGRPAAEPLAEWEIALQQEEAAAAAAQAGGRPAAPADAGDAERRRRAGGAGRRQPRRRRPPHRSTGRRPAEAADAAAALSTSDAAARSAEDASTIHGMAPDADSGRREPDPEGAARCQSSPLPTSSGSATSPAPG